MTKDEIKEERRKMDAVAHKARLKHKKELQQAADPRIRNFPGAPRVLF